MATRASYRSSVSWMSSGRRMKPRVHGTRKPSVTSRASASRTGVRLTPSRSASSISLMRSPGLNWYEIAMSRKAWKTPEPRSRRTLEMEAFIAVQYLCADCAASDLHGVATQYFIKYT